MPGMPPSCCWCVAALPSQLMHAAGGSWLRRATRTAELVQLHAGCRFTVTDAAALEDGSGVFVHWEASGTNLGPIGQQAPSGQPVAFSGLALLRLDEEGRICESLVYRWVWCARWRAWPVRRGAGCQ